MDVYRFSIGILFFIVGILLILIQYREGVYSNKEKVNPGDIRLFFAGVFGVLGGWYFVFTSF
jgi:hypothetical protein